MEASDSRLVMVIPPGSKRARSLGCFAVAWLAITIPGAAVFVWATLDPEVQWEGNGRPPLWGVLLFFSIFLSVGLGMGFFALKMKFESLMLCLELDQLSIQRSFLGRKKLSSTQLREDSRAELTVSYEENDVPVYRVQIDGVSRTEKFATRLTQTEKEWIKLTINRFLGHDVADSSGEKKYCRECGTQLLVGDEKRVCPDCGAVFFDEDETDSAIHSTKAREDVPDVAPEDLPAGSMLKVEDDSVEKLVVSFLLNPSNTLRFVVGGFCLVFSIFWFGLSGFMVWSAITDAGPGSSIFAVFILFMGAIGFGPLSIALIVMFGRARISIDRNWTSVKYHVGPLGMTKKVATDSVQDVLIGDSSFTVTSGGQAPETFLEVTVQTTGKPLSLSFGCREPLARDLCGVTRYQFRRFGCRLAGD